MTTKQDWIGKTGDSWSAQWQRTDRSFGGLTDRLLDVARETSFTRVVDLGCGAGELSLAIARARKNADVLGLDISEKLVEVARSRAGNFQNVAFDIADASHWNAGSDRPDLYVSRHGVMFFDDPTATFAHLRLQAAPDAQMIFSCFREPDSNPWAYRVQGFLPAGSVAPFEPNAPGPFAFADADRITAILDDAGWCNIAIEPFDYAYIAGTGEDPVADALEFFQQIGPAARALASLTPDEKTTYLGKLRNYLEMQEDNGIIAMKAGAWVVTAATGPHRRG